MRHRNSKIKRASLNHTFRLVWSEANQMFVAVAEICTGKGKSKNRGGVVGAVAALALGFAGTAHALDPGALPSGAQISAGQAQISSHQQTLNIAQESQRVAINWQSFNVGANATVNFQQPNASAVALNRVVGNESSVIAGALNANGQVFLLNSQGILFTQGAQVNVGGLVASTLNISDEDFLNGNYTFQTNGRQGSVINLGTLRTADEGYIALLGQQVVNEGIITARLGTAALAAGDRIRLNFNDSSLVGVTIEQGTLDALVANQQAVIADGGLVVMTAQGLDEVMATVVNNTGEVRAQTIEEREGRIFLLGGMESDRIEVAGKLDASAPEGGNGGFIETSAANVQIKEGLSVTTVAPEGQTGLWLIDPTDIVIGATGPAPITGGTNSNASDPAYSYISASAVNTALASSDVTITTASNGVNPGHITVEAPISWTSANDLTLRADADIRIRHTITATDADAKLNLHYGQSSPNAGNTANYYFGSTGGVAGKISLAAGQNFNTKLGSDGATVGWYVITALGVQGDASALSGSEMTLQGMATNLVSHYVLGADIDASATSGWNSGEGFTPVGNGTTAFTGSFNGLGHSITGLTINRPLEDGVGLFGYTEGASISNVTLTNVNIAGYSDVGALIGSASWVSGKGTSVDNVHASGTISGNLSAGGLIGYLANLSTLKNATSSVSVTGESRIDPDEEIDTESPSYIGGLVGNLYNSTIEDSSATGAVTATDDPTDELGAIGGLVGYASGSTIRRSFATGDVKGIGEVSGSPTGYGDGVGGLVGYSGDLTVEDSYATGKVEGVNEVGGLIGNGDGVLTIARSYATGDVEGDWSVGGLIGRSSEGTVTRSYATGNVTGVGFYQKQIGGLVGQNFGDITESYATGHVTGHEDVGGLVGGNSEGDIVRSFATGNVTGIGLFSKQAKQTGGLVGYNHDGAIVDSYATGAVSGTDKVGGLVGWNDGDSVVSSITYAYSAGSVTGTTAVGGLVGDNTQGLIYDSFWDTETSGQPAVGVGVEGVANNVTGKTTAEMKTLATYPQGDGGEIMGWEIVEDSSLSNVYPQLRWATSGLGAGSSVWVIAAYTPPSSGGSGGGSGSEGGGSGVVTPPVVTPPEPPVVEPPVTEPPVVEPPVTEPPVIEPPVTEPPVVEPPVTEPAPQQPALEREIAAVVSQVAATMQQVAPASGLGFGAALAPSLTGGSGLGGLLGGLSFVPPNIQAGLGSSNVMFISSPVAGEPTLSVTLNQARAILDGSADQGTSNSDEDPVSTEGTADAIAGQVEGEREVRVPVSRNSLAEIVNGGLKLPDGVQQQIFIVRSNPQAAD